MQDFEQYTTSSREDNFASILWEMTNEVIEDKASQDQMAYLRRTSKPRILTVKKWISRIQNINALLPHMSEDSISLTKKQMMDEIIIPSIPFQHLREFRLNSNENDSLREISRKLSDIIPDNDENRRDQGKKGNRNNNRDTPRDTPETEEETKLKEVPQTRHSRTNVVYTRTMSGRIAE